MESIKMFYRFDNGEEDVKEIKCVKSNEDGLHDYEVCDMFVDFIRSVGFSEENVFKYFRE